MTPRIRQQPIIDQDGAGNFETEFEEQDLRGDQDKALDDIINEFEAAEDNITYRASICKVPDGYKKGGKEEWCFDVDSAEVTGMRLKMRDVFGPGIYRVRVFKNKKQVRQFDYHIAKPAGTAGVAAHDNPALSAIVENMREQGNQIRALTERLLQGPARTEQIAPPVSPIEMFREFSTIFANMRGPQVQQQDTSLETFMKAAEFARDMQGGSGGGDEGWSGIVKALITSPNAGDIVQAFVSNRSGNRQMQRRPMLNGPQRQSMPMGGQHFVPQQNNTNDIPQPVTGNDPHSLGDQLQSNIRYLIGKAEKNADPGLYAEWLLDNTAQNIIVPMMQNPGTLDQLQAAFPRLAMHRPWFEELIASANDMIAGNQGEQNGNAGATQHFDVNAGGDGGDQSHFEIDGSAGQGSAPGPGGAGVDSIPGT